MAKPRITFAISMSDRVAELEMALQTQISVLEADSWVGKMKDPVKANKYADKIKEVLKMEYFQYPWVTKSVAALHRTLIRDYRKAKNLKDEREALLAEKKTKSTNVQLSFDDFENLKEGTLNEKAQERIKEHFGASESLDAWDLEDEIKELTRRCSLIRFLQAIINSKDLFTSLYKEG